MSSLIAKIQWLAITALFLFVAFLSFSYGVLWLDLYGIFCVVVAGLVLRQLMKGD